MALPVAPLGSLPSMNLGQSGPRVEDPLWKKALANFLTNTATDVTTSGIKGAFQNLSEQDYSKAAAAEGLPGATTPTTDVQSFWSKVLHGPEWDKTRYGNAGEMKREQMRDEATSKYREAQLGVDRERLGIERDRLAQSKVEAEQRLGESEADRVARYQQTQDDLAFRQAVEERIAQMGGTQAELDNLRLQLAQEQFKQQGPLVRAQTAGQLSNIAGDAAKGSPYAEAVSKLMLIQATMTPEQFNAQFPGANTIIDLFKRDQAERRSQYTPMIEETLGMKKPGGNPMLDALNRGMQR